MKSITFFPILLAAGYGTATPLGHHRSEKLGELYNLDADNDDAYQLSRNDFNGKWASVGCLG
jgi:hypothetical protein